MKTRKFLALLMATMPVVGFVACGDDDDDDNNSKQQEYANIFCTVDYSGSSDCLGSPYNVEDGKDDIVTSYCDYSYDAETGTLRLIANNVVRECESKSELEPSFKGDTLFVNVSVPKGFALITVNGDTTYAHTDCDCVYSDTLELSNINKESFILKVQDQTLSGSTEINLSDKKSFSNRLYIDQK